MWRSLPDLPVPYLSTTQEHHLLISVGEFGAGEAKRYYERLDKFMAKHPDLYITTRHAYVINYKFNWKCTATGCDYRIGRHSKSLDVARFVCPKCAAPLAACAAPGA